MQLMERFIHGRGKIYAKVVKEEIPFGWQPHVFTMRVTGIRSTADNTRWYKSLTIGCFLSIGFVFSILQFVNIFFVDSIVDFLIIFNMAIACDSTTMKTAVLYWQNGSIRELLTIHKRLWCSAGNRSYEHDRVARITYIIHVIISIFYMAIAIAASIQTVCSMLEAGVYASTAHYPLGLVNSRSLYMIVLIMQASSAVVVITWTTIEDSFIFTLLVRTCAYVVELKVNFMKLGTEVDKGEDPVQRYYQDLVKWILSDLIHLLVLLFLW